jgi:hypothetical protein
MNFKYFHFAGNGILRKLQPCTLRRHSCIEPRRQALHVLRDYPARTHFLRPSSSGHLHSRNRPDLHPGRRGSLNHPNSQGHLQQRHGHNAQAFRKRALDMYQNQLVTRPAIPVSNQFTALRIVAKNSATDQLRQAWEVPKPAPRPAQTKTSQRRQCKPQAPAEAIYKAHRALKQRKSVRNARSRQHVSRSSPSEDMAQQPAIVPAPRPGRIVSKATPNVQ